MTILENCRAAFWGGARSIFIGLVCLMVVFSIMSSSFFTLNNIMNLTRQVSISAILAVGMTIAIIGGGIDLSVGSIVAFVQRDCGQCFSELAAEHVAGHPPGNRWGP